MPQASRCVKSSGGGPLAAWAKKSPGRELVLRECHCVDEMLSGLFGYYLLQLGGGKEFVESVDRSRIRQHVILDGGFPGLGADRTIIGDERACPVATDSVDAVFLPHTLDFSDEPHAVLRESERVLIPEGRLIVLGFNPLSLWGGWRALRKNSGMVPWCGNFISQRRVLDWLNLLGFDVEMQRPVMFLPPLRGSAMLRRCEVFEPLGERWLPQFSAAYAIRAVKRVSTLTPIRPSWKANTNMLPGQAVEPTIRTPLG